MNHQLHAIWDALDNAQYKSALQLTTRALKRNPTSLRLRGLKALSLSKLGNVEEAILICDSLAAQNPDDLEIYTTVKEVLEGHDRDGYLANLYGCGFKATSNEKLGRAWFMEMLRVGDYGTLRRCGTTLLSKFTGREYFFWVVSSMTLLQRDLEGQGKKDLLLDTLTLRMITKASSNVVEPKITTSEEFLLFLDILRKAGRWKEAVEVVDGALGTALRGNQEVMRFRFDVLENLGLKLEIKDYCRRCWRDGVDDWRVYDAFIKAVDQDTVLDARDELEVLQRASPRSRNRGLALVKLAHKFRSLDELEATRLLDSCLRYFHTFSGKLCCFEDLQMYVLVLSHSDRTTFMETEIDDASHSEIDKALVTVNRAKFRFMFGVHQDLDTDAFVEECTARYSQFLKLGADLEVTDNQYGDDLIILAVQSILESTPSSHSNSSRKSDSDSDSDFHSDVPDTTVGSLLDALVLLEYAQSRSKHNFQFKLYLIRIYRLLGAFSSAHAIFKTMAIKHVQRDSMSYILFSDSCAEAPSSATLAGLQETQHIYRSNAQETPDMLSAAYENGAYSKVEEFILFKSRLDRSLWKYVSDVQIWNMNVLLDKVDWTQRIPEVGNVVYDNRSQEVLLNCLPIGVDSRRALWPKTTRNEDATACDQEVARVKRHLERFRKLQCILRKDPPFASTTHGELQSTSAAKDDDRRGEELDDDKCELMDLLYELYLIQSNPTTSPDPTLKTLSLLISKATDTLQSVPGQRYDRTYLHNTSHAVETLKVMSLALPSFTHKHIRLNKGFTKIASQMTSAQQAVGMYIDSIRQDLTYSKTSARRIDETKARNRFKNLLHVDEYYVEQIFERLVTSQIDGLSGLLHILGTIK